MPANQHRCTLSGLDCPAHQTSWSHGHQLAICASIQYLPSNLHRRATALLSTRLYHKHCQSMLCGCRNSCTSSKSSHHKVAPQPTPMPTPTPAPTPNGNPDGPKPTPAPKPMMRPTPAPNACDQSSLGGGLQSASTERMHYTHSAHLRQLQDPRTS